MSNSLDPDQNVGPDLGPNCLQRLSADSTGKQRVKLAERSRCIRSVYHITSTLYYSKNSEYDQEIPQSLQTNPWHCEKEPHN